MAKRKANPDNRRINTIRLDPGKRQTDELKILGDRVSRLWNAANYICRQRFLAYQRVPLGFNLETQMKAQPEYRQLPSDIAQETLKKLSEAWKSYFQLRSLWRADPAKNQKPGLPKYRKDRKKQMRPFDFIPIKHPRSYSLDAKDAHLVLPRDRRKSFAGGRLHTAYRGRLRHQGANGRAEIRFDRVRRRWHMSISVDLLPRPKHEIKKIAAIDLGVRITASLSIEGRTRASHFESRELLRDWDALAKDIALEQSAIAGTRGKADDTRAPSSRAISLLYRKRQARLEHGLKTMAKAIAEECVDQNVDAVYVGWPKNILREVKYGSSLWAGRIHNFWSFAKTIAILKSALAAQNIECLPVGERGSSSHCPACDSENVSRSPRSLLRCKDCGEKIHSDQAGSRNIAKSQKPSLRWAGAEAAPRTATQRWTRHRWTLRSVNPRLRSPQKFSKPAAPSAAA